MQTIWQRTPSPFSRAHRWPAIAFAFIKKEGRFSEDFCFFFFFIRLELDSGRVVGRAGGSAQWGAVGAVFGWTPPYPCVTHSFGVSWFFFLEWQSAAKESVLHSVLPPANFFLTTGRIRSCWGRVCFVLVQSSRSSFIFLCACNKCSSSRTV